MKNKLRLLKKLLAGGLIIFQFGFLYSFSYLIFAQESTPSAETISQTELINSLTPTTIPTETITPIETIISTENITPTQNIIPTSTPIPTLEPSVIPTINPPTITPINISPSPLLLEPTPETFNSATLQPTPKLRKLSKKDFRLNEPVEVIIDNATAESTKVALFNSLGEEVNLALSYSNNNGSVFYKLYPSRSFKPGRYHLKITDINGTIYTEDFTWGVLAINPNKSIYIPGETAKFSFAVLDEAGIMVCDAKLTLQITNSELGIDDLLSTENGKIIANPECQIKGYVEKPDYEAFYTVGGTGKYNLVLTAETVTGTHTISDAFEVSDNINFDLERKTATRIYPPAVYSMTFNLKANEDFNGTFSEKVPLIFAVSHAPDGIISFDNLSIATSSAAINQQKEFSIPDLGLPFEGSHPISLFFGQQLRDPLLKDKYAEFGLLGHDGIDFDMPIGTPVLAVDDGEVVLAEDNGDYGKTIVIQHSWGKSYYGHLSEITTVVGRKKQKGFPIGLSGNTGLSTGPHLHFGIKPNNNNIDNGYYGKIDPLPYLNISGYERIKSLGVSDSYQLLTWNLSLKKGESIKLGYQYQVPNISPQFYLLGPAQLVKEDGSLVFEEARQWQLAIDVGSGSCTVTPTTGTVSATNNTYTFTFTAEATMNSGEFTITVPSSGSPNWSAPQGTPGTAGYTTAVGNGNATVGTVLVSADSTTQGAWTLTEDDSDACNTSNPAVDATQKIEGTGSIKCGNVGNIGPDDTDSFSFDNSGTVNWSSYNEISFWLRSTKALDSTNGVEFAYDDTALMSSVLQTYNTGTVSANTWTYLKFTLTATRTAVKAFGLVSNGNGFDSCDIWLDEVMIGPGVPTFSGSGPWTISVRILDAATSETFTVIYGNTAGGAGSTVTNSSTAGVHTFTVQSRTSVSGTLDTIATSPIITLSTTGPTLDQLMRHGKWFNSSGVRQPFTF